MKSLKVSPLPKRRRKKLFKRRKKKKIKPRKIRRYI